MTTRLDGKIAVVTAATAGIGRAIATTFVQRGATVVGMARSPGPGAELEAELGDGFTFVAGDVTRSPDCNRLAQTALDRFGHIDICVNNAGGGLPLNRVENVSDDDWQTIIGFTLSSCFMMCRAVLPSMQSRRSGVIVNLASFAGEQGLTFMGPYAAAKAGVIQLTKVIAVENRDLGIRANTLVVGAVATDQSRDTGKAVSGFLKGPGFVPDKTKSIGAFANVRMDPEAVARTVALVCGDDAAELTGATIAVDRGFSAGWLSATLLDLVATQSIDWPPLP
jgi:NAD(P)-dependent dehydrogenase (short-subunit alcohol dehydrogenase family)